MKQFTIFIILICIFSALFSGILSHIIYYHEQHQLFLFSKSYFYKNLSLPGGLTEYISAFFVQFFYYPVAGSIIFSILIALTYYLNTVICKQITGQQDPLHLSLLIPLYLITQYSIPEFPVSVTIGILLNQLALILLFHLPRKAQYPFSFLFTAILYLLSGAYCLLFILAIIIYACFRITKIDGWLIPLFVIFGSGIPFIGSYFYSISIQDSITGILPDTPYLWILLILLLLPLLSARYIPLLLPKQKQANILLAGCLLVYSLGTIAMISHTYDKRTRLMLQVDNYVKKQDWDNVLKYTAQYEGKNHLVTYLTNLALFHTRQMPGKMFKYQQDWGTESLFFPWTGNSRESEYGDLVYADLGYLNDAHRWAFEAMTVFGETAPTLQKLVRYNIANERPRVAKRFINILKQSLFYRPWAEKMEKAIQNHQRLPFHRVNENPAHPARFSNFLDVGPDLLYLCDREPQNQMAFEYLMSYYLISNQVIQFKNNLWRIQAFSYPKLPKLYDEALLIYKLGVPEDVFRQIGMDVQPETTDRFERYYNMLRNSSRNQQQIKDLFGDTYWYYMNFESPYGSKIIDN